VSSTDTIASSLRTGLEPLLEKVAIAMAARGAPPLGHPAAPGTLSRVGRGLRNTGLALGAGALAAGALGLGHQYEEDQHRFPLVYQPMSSGYGP
jgi:hypothetical protein